MSGSTDSVFRLGLCIFAVSSGIHVRMAFLHHSWSWMVKRHIGLPHPLHSWLHKCDYHYRNCHVCMKSAAENLFEAYVDLVDVYSSEPNIH